MFWWFSYQMEIEAFGVGNSITARDCNKGAASPCTFVQFIKHVNNGELIFKDWSKVRKK